MTKIGLINQPELCDKIQKHGNYDVVFNCEGAEARKYLELHLADVVITDLLMQGEDGFALMEKYHDTKFIVASELKSEVFIIKALDLGASYYMVKPVEMSLLEQRIEQVVAPTASITHNVHKRSVSEKALDERISAIFANAGIHAQLKGYQYLREGIKLAVYNPPIIGALTKQLYPAIAETFETTSTKVERAIRHALEVAWNSDKIENVNALFGAKVFSPTEKPTNGEFIALLADKMLLEFA